MGSTEDQSGGASPLREISWSATEASGLIGSLHLPHVTGLSAQQCVELAKSVVALHAYAAAVEAIAAARIHACFDAMEPDAEAPGGGPERLGGDPVHALAAAELAAAQGITEAAASRTLVAALALDGPLSCVRDALAMGRIDETRTRIVVDQAQGLDPEAAAEFARKAMARLTTRTGRLRTAQEFRRTLARLREQEHHESIRERRTRAAQDRGVWFRPESDGMCQLTALMPAETGLAVYGALDTAARAHRAAHGEDPRTLAQLRADLLAHAAFTDTPLPVLTSAFEGANGPAAGSGTANAAAGSADAPRNLAAPPAADCSASVSGIKAEIVILMPLETLVGADGEPAILEGFGPLDPTTARALAAAAPTWHRLWLDAEGAPLRLGRTSYRPTAAQRRFIEYRDVTCVFPGCNRSARRSDVDHTEEWALGGRTDVDNLAALCPKHHAIKSIGHWTMSQAAAERRTARDTGDERDDSVTICPDTGRITWTSALGFSYFTGPHEYKGITGVATRPDSSRDLEQRAAPEPPADPHAPPWDPDEGALWAPDESEWPGEPEPDPDWEPPEAPPWMVADDAVIEAQIRLYGVNPPPF